MAESLTVARPYAEAVFRLGRESSKLADWSGWLGRLSLIANESAMQDCFGNPKLNSRQVTDLVVGVLGVEAPQALSRFIEVLAENGRLALLPEIQTIFEELKSDEEGVKEAHIVSAFPMDDTQVGQIMPVLEQHFSSKLKPRVTVEPSLIGGIKVVVGDEVFDASVRGQLDAMAVALKN
jgi:F-type H+-transporting ATPase subunit delta